MQLTAKNNRETEKIGEQIAARLKGGDILCLKGDLGAGKTTLVKGLARAFKIKNDITSPTFTLMNIYDIRTTKTTKIQKLIHIDTYRLKNEEELHDIGVEDYLGRPDTICVIEWPEKISKLLNNKKTIAVTIEHSKRNERIIKVNSPAKRDPRFYTETRGFDKIGINRKQ